MEYQFPVNQFIYVRKLTCKFPAEIEFQVSRDFCAGTPEVSTEYAAQGASVGSAGERLELCHSNFGYPGAVCQPAL